MLANQRYTQILEKLNAFGVVKVSELKKEFNTSAETIRKDLESLHQAGYIERVHGGAVLKNSLSTAAESHQFVEFDKRKIRNRKEKYAIALTAASLIKEGQSIALDTGTSSYELACVLKKKFQNLTVLTNSLPNACELVTNRGFTVIATGGILTADEHSFISDFATLIIDRVTVDFMFLTAYGVCLENGITDQRIEEVLIHNKLRSISKKTIVLADSTKFGCSSFVRVCSLNEVDTLITDSGLDTTVQAQFRQAGHNLIIAE